MKAITAGSAENYWRRIKTMRRLKELLFSQKGMRVVNALFFISLLFYRSGFVFIAYIAWIVYLIFCLKHTESKSGRIIYSVFIGIAAVMVCLNLFFLLRQSHLPDSTIGIIGGADGTTSILITAGE